MFAYQGETKDLQSKSVYEGETKELGQKSAGSGINGRATSDGLERERGWESESALVEWKACGSDSRGLGGD